MLEAALSLCWAEEIGEFLSSNYPQDLEIPIFLLRVQLSFARILFAFDRAQIAHCLKKVLKICGLSSIGKSPVAGLGEECIGSSREKTSDFENKLGLVAIEAAAGLFAVGDERATEAGRSALQLLVDPTPGYQQLAKVFVELLLGEADVGLILSI